MRSIAISIYRKGVYQGVEVKGTAYWLKSSKWNRIIEGLIPEPCLRNSGMRLNCRMPAGGADQLWEQKLRFLRSFAGSPDSGKALPGSLPTIPSSECEWKGPVAEQKHMSADISIPSTRPLRSLQHAWPRPWPSPELFSRAGQSHCRLAPLRDLVGETFRSGGFVNVPSLP